MVNHVAGTSPVGFAVRGTRLLELERFLGRWRPGDLALRIPDHRANGRPPHDDSSTDNETGIDNNNTGVGQRGFRLSGLGRRGLDRGRGRRIVKFRIALRMRAASVRGYHGSVAAGVTPNLNLPQGGRDEKKNNPESHTKTVTRPRIPVKADLK